MMTGPTGRVSVWNLIQTVCFVVIAVAVVKQVFFPMDPSAPLKPQELGDQEWAALKASGHWIGSPDAKVVLVEFSDFECPACRLFTEKSLMGARAEFGDSLAVLYRSWPLSYHANAYEAAMGGWCAAAQGRFSEFHDVVYSHQSELGDSTLVSFADQAGVNDVDRFERCVVDSLGKVDIEADMAAVAALGGTGTPTIILNGSLWRVPPDSAAFSLAVRAAMKKARSG